MERLRGKREVEPFDPKKHKPVQTAGQSYATEYLASEKVPEGKGKFFNIPTIWFDKETKEPLLFGKDRAINEAIIYENRTGKKFPRYSSQEKAEEAAKKRSKKGGASKETLGKAEGGAVMQEQMRMAFMQEGGMQDDGGETEPKSGNKVPSGSLKEEVADDIPAMLSEGEFVFPADVVRYIGLETLMKMRQDAKQGLKMMEKMGQLGNPDEAEIPDDIPFGMADLVVISGEMKKDKEEKAEGGVVGLQEGGSLEKLAGVDYFTPNETSKDVLAGPIGDPNFPDGDFVDPRFDDQEDDDYINFLIERYKKQTGETYTPEQVKAYKKEMDRYYSEVYNQEDNPQSVMTTYGFMPINEFLRGKKINMNFSKSRLNQGKGSDVDRTYGLQDESLMIEDAVATDEGVQPTGGGGLFDDERFKPADTGQGDPTVYTDEDVKQIQEGLTDVPAPGDITIKKLVNKDNPDDFIMHPFEGDEPLFDIPDNYVVDESEPARPVTSRQPMVQADDDRDRSKGLAPLQAPQVTSSLDPRDEDITKAMEQVTAEIGNQTLYDKNGRPITLQKQTLDQFKTELEEINKIDNVNLSFKEYYNLPTRDKVRFSLQARLGTPPTDEQVNKAIEKAQSPTGLTGILSPITSLIKNVFSAEAYNENEVKIDTEFRDLQDKINTAQTNLNNLVTKKASPYGKKGYVTNKEYEDYLNDAQLASGARFSSTGMMGKVDDFLLGIKRDPRNPNAAAKVFTGRTKDNPSGFVNLTADSLGRIEQNRAEVQQKALQAPLTAGKTAVETSPGNFMYVPSQESGDSEAQNKDFLQRAEERGAALSESGGRYGSAGQDNIGGVSSAAPDIGGFGFYVGGVPTKPMKPQRLKKGGLARPKVKPKRMKKGGLASRKK